jgi:hypothetical protein
VAGLTFAGLDLAALDLAGLDLAGLDLGTLDLAALDLAGLDLGTLDLAGLDLAGLDPAARVAGAVEADLRVLDVLAAALPAARRAGTALLPAGSAAGFAGIFAPVAALTAADALAPRSRPWLCPVVPRAALVPSAPFRTALARSAMTSPRCRKRARRGAAHS